MRSSDEEYQDICPKYEVYQLTHVTVSESADSWRGPCSNASMAMHSSDEMGHDWNASILAADLKEHELLCAALSMSLSFDLEELASKLNVCAQPCIEQTASLLSQVPRVPVYWECRSWTEITQQVIQQWTIYGFHILRAITKSANEQCAVPSAWIKSQIIIVASVIAIPSSLS